MLLLAATIAPGEPYERDVVCSENQPARCSATGTGATGLLALLSLALCRRTRGDAAEELG